MLRVTGFISILYIFLPLVVSGNVTVADKHALRILNGKAATEGEFPYMVALKLKITQLYKTQPYVTTCGGSLIKESWILTSAKCFAIPGNACQLMCKKPQFSDTKLFHAVAGSIKNRQDFEENGQWRTIAKLATHPKYWLFSNDVAIAHTNKPFELNDKVKTISYATKHKDYGDISCKVAGFGATTHQISLAAIPETLMWADLEIVAEKKCSDLHKGNMHDFVCFKSDKTNLLSGDTGSPVVCTLSGDKDDKGQGVVVGIGIDMFSKKKYLTRVSSYSDFIARGLGCEASCPVSYIVWLSTYHSLFKYLQRNIH